MTLEDTLKLLQNSSRKADTNRSNLAQFNFDFQPKGMI